MSAIGHLAGLLERLEDAAGRAAQRPGRTLASVTVRVDSLDPSALAFGSRLADERWFCWEHPDRDGMALGAVGAAAELISRGPGRFGDLARESRELLHGAVIDAPAAAPAGTGPVFCGGFAFDPHGGREPQWSSLPPALMVLPEISAFRMGGDCHLTVNLVAGPGVDVVAECARLSARLGALREAPLGPLDPTAMGKAEVGAPRPPEHYERIVADGRDRIRAGALEKVVLAREVRVQAPAAHDAGAILAAMREVFPACFCFCVGTPEAAFVGASPELLIRRAGAGAVTVALAGSARRSADPAVDDHLGQQLLLSDKDRTEHAVVVKRIERALRPLSVWVAAEPEPGIAKVANIQHLATPIRAQLADAHGAIELAGRLHPTPAVGGEPRDRAAELIAEIEELDRGWYAGPVGWSDAAEDGEFCVALRSALLRDRTAHLYAGAGIVGDSDPAAELAETELKLGAMLPLVS